MGKNDSFERSDSIFGLHPTQQETHTIQRVESLWIDKKENIFTKRSTSRNPDLDK